MPYQSNPGGLYNSGVFPSSRPRIDLSPVFDALTGGATSLVHSQILRQQNANELGLRKQQLSLQQQEAADRKSESDREFGLRQDTERHRSLEAGIVPAHSDITQVPGTAPIAPMNPAPSPVQNAMTGGGGGGMPGVQVTPSNAPGSIAPAAAPSSTTMYTPQSTTTPESYDPAKAGMYLRSVAVQGLRNEGWGSRDEHKQEFQAEQQTQRLAAQQAGRAYSAQAAQGLARLRASLAGAKTPAQRAMTGNSLEAANEKVAAGYLETFNGNLNDAVTALESPDGEDLRKQGVTKNHLLAAFGKSNANSTKQGTGQILGLLNSGAAKDIPGATETVKTARGAATALGRSPVKAQVPDVPVGPSTPATQPTAMTSGNATDVTPAVPATKPTRLGSTPPVAAAQPTPTTSPTRLGSSAKPDPKIAAKAAAAVWRAKNPRTAGESDADYYARYQKANP